MNEFGLIARYFDWPAPAGWLGVGDDAALVPLTADRELAVSVDMMIEGRHFFADADPACLARKASRVSSGRVEATVWPAR